MRRNRRNPIGNLTVLPFENYTNFEVGPNKGTQNILEFEPVVPIHLNADWNLINRAIIPVVWNPDLSPFPSVPQAFAPTDYSAFLSPRNLSGGWTVGAGPIVQLPTATSPTVGSSVWGLGPTAVVVKTTEQRRGPAGQPSLVAGRLDSGPGGKRYATFLVEPFVNYNFGGGWFISSAPIITDDETHAGRKWTVPIGAVAGRIIKLGGKLPVKFSIGGYYNVVTPEYGARWQLQSVVAVIFLSRGKPRSDARCNDRTREFDRSLQTPRWGTCPSGLAGQQPLPLPLVPFAVAI